MLQILSLISEKFSIGDINIFIFNLILAAVLFVIGIGLGKFVKFLLKKIVEKAILERAIKKSFINLFLAVIEWSIYLLFITLALDQLGIPQITNWITSVIVVIPALVGALILIGVGFAIAVYLRDLIEESKILNWKVLSLILFYFVIYVFLVFALKTALISVDKSTVNIMVLILTGIIGAGVTYWHVIKK